MHFLVSGSYYLCIAKHFRDGGTSSFLGAAGACGVRNRQVRGGQQILGCDPLVQDLTTMKRSVPGGGAVTTSYTGFTEDCVKHHTSTNTTPETQWLPQPHSCCFQNSTFETVIIVGEVNQEGRVPLVQLLILVSQIIYRRAQKTSRQALY